EHWRPLSVHDPAVALCGVHRPLGPWIACAGRRTGRSLRAEKDGNEGCGEGAGRSHHARRVVPGSVEGNGQAARSVQLTRGGAPPDRGRRRPVSQVHRPREESGEEAQRRGQRRSGVSSGGEGREGEFYGASAEGRIRNLKLKT